MKVSQKKIDEAVKVAAAQKGLITIGRAVELIHGAGEPPQDCGESKISEAVHNRPMRFEMGAVVTLKSGGALMTVVDASCSSHPMTEICVAWHNKFGFQEQEFPRACLRFASDEEIRAGLAVNDIPF